MTKTISKIGNSHGIIFDAALMDLARLKVGDQMTVTVHEGGSIVLFSGVNAFKVNVGYLGVAITNGAVRDIPIRAGEIFYLPPRVPHSPQRMPDSIGLVIERRRVAGEQDGLMWFCQQCNHKLYEEYFTLDSIERDFPPVFERFYRSLEARTCTQCGTVHPAPAKYA